MVSMWRYPMKFQPAAHDDLDWIIRDIKEGIDCGIKSPFELNLSIPKGKAHRRHKTEFYGLHDFSKNIEVGIKYYPDEKGCTRVAVRVKDLSKTKTHKQFGVNAKVYVNGRQRHFLIDDYGEKANSWTDHHNFGVNIANSKEFLDEEKNGNNDEGVQIKVVGYVYFWDRRLKMRELWKFGPGVSGYEDEWENPEDVKNLEFVTREGRSIWANLDILAKNSEYFRRIHATGHLPKIELLLHYNPAEKGVKLCYDFHLMNCATLNEKLELLLFFDKFEVSDYKKQVEEHLVEYIDGVNVGRLARFSIHAHAENLQRSCLDFIKRCMQTGKFFFAYEYQSVREMIDEAAERENWPQRNIPTFL